MVIRHDYSCIKYRLEQIIVTTCCDMHYIIGLNKAFCEPSRRGKLVLVGGMSMVSETSAGRNEGCSILAVSVIQRGWEVGFVVKSDRANLWEACRLRLDYERC